MIDQLSDSPVLLAVLCGVDAGINVQGREGGSMSFTCSHSNARSNKKYLCKYPCNNATVKVQVEAGKTFTKDRVFLNDFGDGDFRVTFHHLKMSDDGLYYCGVERRIQHTYIDVHLIVLKGECFST